MENLKQQEISEGNTIDYREIILVGRHFDDVDDLTNGLDTALQPLSNESVETLNTNVREIIQNTEIKDFNKVLMISSPRKRTLLTSQLIKDAILAQRPGLQIRIKSDNRFSELSHGNIILSDDYTPGKRIDFLKEAWKAFWNETFAEDAEYNNLNYKFGDPVSLGNGNFKYPEIVKTFSAFGESYRELGLRYYLGILEYFRNKNRIDNAGINVVLIAHSATLSILTELEHVATHNTIMTNFKTGDLMKICWKQYLERIKGQTSLPNFGYLKAFSLVGLNSDIVNLLEKEVEFLSESNNYEKK